MLTICVGKSTYARCGIITNVTPFEPEWEGFVTLEISNTTPLPAKIYANEGIAQVIFFESDEVCETSYKDRGGKYQGQQGVTLTMIPQRAYVLLPRQQHSTLRGMRKYSTVRASANELGGMMQTSPMKSTKDPSSNAFGSTIVELMFVKILNAFEQRMS